MRMLMMAIGKVGVAMAQSGMPMFMGMRLSNRIVRPMNMQMMNIVHMEMIMLLRSMLVFVLMPLRQMQPNARDHEQASPYELPC